MNYYYKIAGIIIQIQCPIDIKIQDESKPFLITSCNHDVAVQFIEENEIPEKRADLIYAQDINAYFENGHYVMQHFLQNREDVYAWLVKSSMDFYQCHYLRQYENQFSYSLAMLNLISLEQILLDFHAMILHCSFVKWKDKGILFTGPSGIGKSTQASLWEQCESAQIINGDRAILRNHEGKWKTHGLPFAGSSGIYRNDTVDLVAIVVLKQGKVNKLRKLSPMEAFKNIYNETTSQKWNKDAQIRIMDLITELIQSINVYELECLPDDSAVDILKKELEDGTKIY